MSGQMQMSANTHVLIRICHLNKNEYLFHFLAMKHFELRYSAPEMRKDIVIKRAVLSLNYTTNLKVWAVFWGGKNNPFFLERTVD